MKTCFKCKTTKPLSQYYKHKGMSDGHLNKCKECAKKDAQIKREPRVCVECGSDFKTHITEIKRGGGLTCSRDCYYDRLRKIVKREEHSPNWKGDDVKKGALHDWVRKHLGKPKKCEHCGTEKAKQYDWANKSHQYKRDISDWIRLCRSCHAKYDYPVRSKKWAKCVRKRGWKVIKIK